MSKEIDTENILFTTGANNTTDEQIVNNNIDEYQLN